MDIITSLSQIQSLSASEIRSQWDVFDHHAAGSFITFHGKSFNQFKIDNGDYGTYDVDDVLNWLGQ